MSLSTCDVAIIGGGVIGLSCAWRLAQRGAKVHLFERGQVGREASWAAAGMLAAQSEAAVHAPHSSAEYSQRDAFFQLSLRSRAMYAKLAVELLDETGIDIELSLNNTASGDWRTSGILFLGDEGDMAFECFGGQAEQGERVEQLDTNALWLNDEGQVENRKLTAALGAAAKNAGVKIHEQCEVVNISKNALKTSHGSTDCQKILNCAGAWSTQIHGAAAACLPPVRPVAGEVLAVRTSTPLRHIIYSREVYLVPRLDGRVLIGATMNEIGYDKSTTVVARDYLLRAAQHLLPNENFVVEDHWAGLRPATPDGMPVLGSTPVEDLYVATGHFRNGILLTPITAQLMADCILEGKEPPREFSIDRFAAGVLAA